VQEYQGGCPTLMLVAEFEDEPMAKPELKCQL